MDAGVPETIGRTDRPGTRLLLARLVAALLAVALSGGCATVRLTDPPRTATEQFLINEATARSIDKLVTDPLRDRTVFVDTTNLAGDKLSNDQAFLVGELRAKLMAAGARVAAARKDAQVILEVRSRAIGIDRYDNLLGIPAIILPSTPGSTPLATPEVALLKNQRQRGYTSVSIVAYWADTGELVATSGPFVGQTYRDDFWFFGFGPKTSGDIPPAQNTDAVKR